MSYQKSSIYLTCKGEAVPEEEALPSNQLVFSADGTPMPLDIQNKTIKELREMGFKDVINFKATRDPVSGGMQPIFSMEEKHKLHKLAKEMEADIGDPTHHIDTLG